MYFVLCVTNLALWLQETNKLTYLLTWQVRILSLDLSVTITNINIRLA